MRQDDTEIVLAQFSAAGLGDCVAVIGQPVNNGHVSIRHGENEVFAGERRLLQRQWAETSYQIQRLRDNAECADQEFDALLEEDNPGLSAKLSFDVNEDIAAPFIKRGVRPGGGAARAGRQRRWRWPPRSIAPASQRSTCT